MKPIELKLKIHSKTRNRTSVSFVVGCLAACGLMASTAVAQGLVRAEFQSQTTATPGVFDDGHPGFTCNSGDFDYLDATDSGVDCSPNPAEQSGFNISTTSNGGGWALKVGEEYPGQNPRKIRIDFSGYQDETACEGLWSTFFYDMELDCGCYLPCNVNVWITADKLFKKNTTRDPLHRFDIVEVGGDGPDGPDLKIRYHEDLYICEAADHVGDADWQVLRSAPCEETNLAAGALADVILPAGGPGQDEILGQWLLPFEVTAQRVIPSDEPPGCIDADNDGVCYPDDCEDENPDIYPGHNDTRGKWGRDGVDNDCNGIIDG